MPNEIFRAPVPGNPEFDRLYQALAVEWQPQSMWEEDLVAQIARNQCFFAQHSRELQHLAMQDPADETVDRIMCTMYRRQAQFLRSCRQARACLISVQRRGRPKGLPPGAVGAEMVPGFAFVDSQGKQTVIFKPQWRRKDAIR